MSSAGDGILDGGNSARHGETTRGESVVGEHDWAGVTWMADKEQVMSERSLEERIGAIEDRVAIIDVLCRFAVSIDRRRWDDFASCFADEVDLNVIRTKRWVHWSRPEFIARLQQVFESYTATQHISANHQITLDGPRAVAVSTLNATHYLKDMPGGEFQQQVGYYEYHLSKDLAWRITSVRQIEHWQTGNQEIFDRTL
jgi:hypothetical protein